MTLHSTAVDQQMLVVGGRSGTWSALTVRISWWPSHLHMHLLGGRSARWSAYMSSNTKNLKLPFRIHWQILLGGGVDLPGDLPIWAPTVKSWNCHSDPLADLMGGRSATWSANMSLNSLNSKNLKLPFRSTGRSTEGVDLPLDLPIWASTVEMSHHINHISTNSMNLNSMNALTVYFPHYS